MTLKRVLNKDKNQYLKVKSKFSVCQMNKKPSNWGEKLTLKDSWHKKFLIECNVPKYLDSPIIVETS